YEGLIKCKVLAPTRLHIPVLPMKCYGKLMFSLCRSCTEAFQQRSCEHTQARLKLYIHLKPFGNRVLYCDTDSIVFTSTPGQWEPQLGDYLGDLTDEVSNNAITAFVTGGPKTMILPYFNQTKKDKHQYARCEALHSILKILLTLILK
ncbi:hypothetical protein MAR_007464, partial [Mya arenaria]